jgi:glycosyltransferase involved in cell wall biosynthesis
LFSRTVLHEAYNGNGAGTAASELRIHEPMAGELGPGSVTAVVPAMNEGRNIGWVLSRVPSIVDEVIVVDGNSTDDTVAVARAACPDLVLVEQSGRGKGDAVRAGLRAARGDYVVMIDADGSMDPREIVNFVDKLRAGYDFVKGSRYLDGGGSSDLTPVRALGNRCLLGMVNALYYARFTDLCYGFFAFRRNALQWLELDADGFEIETQIAIRALKANLQIGEVASLESPRRYGESNLSAVRDGWRVLHTLVRERRDSTRVSTVELQAQVEQPSLDGVPAG